MVRLAVVRGLSYTDMGQVQNRWLIPAYATAFRWTGNQADAEDLTAWVFHNLGLEFRAPELVQVVEERVAELLSEAIARHWSVRYGVAGVIPTASAPNESHPTLEKLLAELSGEAHRLIVLRFVRGRPVAAIARQLRLSVREADDLTFVGLAQVAERIGLRGQARNPQQVHEVSTFITGLVTRRNAARFEARWGTWQVLVAACHIHAAIAGNDLPSRRFVGSPETAPRRLVTELRIWSA